MPRRLRTHLPGLPLHIVQRGHNRDACFFGDDDYYAYRALFRPELEAEAISDVRLALA